MIETQNGCQLVSLIYTCAEINQLSSQDFEPGSQGRILSQEWDTQWITHFRKSTFTFGLMVSCYIPQYSKTCVLKTLCYTTSLKLRLNILTQCSIPYCCCIMTYTRTETHLLGRELREKSSVVKQRRVFWGLALSYAVARVKQ